MTGMNLAPLMSKGGCRAMNPKFRRTDAVRLHAHWILYFHEAVKAGSIRAAAKELNVAPSAISRQLRDIEAILGDRLIERSAAGLRLTAAGEVVADHVNQVLYGLSRVQGALEELRGLQRGHLVIAAVPSTGAELLPRILSAFRLRHPRITFSCDFHSSPQIFKLVAEGDADVGITFNPPPSPAVRQIISVPLPFGAVMSPTFTFAARPTVRLYDLVDSGAPLIFPDEANTLRAQIEDMLGRSALSAEPVVTTLNRDFMIGMAQRGAGIAFQTPLGIERELQEGSLVFVPVIEPEMKPQQLTVLVSARRPPSPTASLAAELIRAGVAELLK
jgi:DNA-binding transcriptional LysR family regulator